jgi:hypothetical protein
VLDGRHTFLFSAVPCADRVVDYSRPLSRIILDRNIQFHQLGLGVPFMFCGIFDSRLFDIGGQKGGSFTDLRFFFKFSRRGWRAGRA